ncbi:MAG: hypothetical protein ACREA9_02735, partial [Pyrinomonadaceae bacterium]
MDCPRFTQRKDWAENWNGGNEVVTNYTAPVSVTQLPDGTQGSSWKFCQMQTPDDTYYNVYSRSSGWDEGLPVLEDTWATMDQQITFQRRSTISYTQDNTGVTYPLNPRTSETNVYDTAGNHKRTAVSCTSYSVSCGTGCSTTINLPTETKEYAADAATVLRTSKTDYNTDAAYTSRRIVGIPSKQQVFEGTSTGALMSKVEFFYDDSGEFLAQQGTPIQHDATNYGTSLTTGRANLTRTKRWDVINTSQYTETKVGYNTTGSPILTRNPLQTSDTQANIVYTDSFSDGQNHNTYAYPTEVTIKDTVGTTPSVPISNKTQYSFDTGAVTRTEGPPPAGQSLGAIFTSAYDSADRLYQATNTFNGAYTYIVYPTSSNVIQTYVTITSTSTPTVSSKLYDGAGRVRATAAEHPGSTGGYVGQITVYDKMGRAIQTSNPTEIYGTWQPAGDDAASGWIYSYQTYDWKGRPRITTNQDGTTRELTYGSCGCAGGEAVTARDEMARRQRIKLDVLGRPWKKEVLGWDGTTVYSTVTNTYNARDQITRVLEQVGTTGTSQETLMTYDGYGRLLTSHRPEQASGAITSYLYYADGSPQSVTDGRGAMTAYGYNNRRLVTQVSYSAPSGSEFVVPTTTLFVYDSAGNRTFMDDELGSVTYEADPLSRITTETRQFDASLPQAPLSNNRFRLSYTYNLVGLLTGLTDPYGQQFYYTRDNLGRLTSVTGSSFGGVTQYASNAQYRASGALKRLEYGNGQIMKITAVNNRLQATNFEISKTGTDVIKKQYQYYSDGQLRFSQDQLNPKFDRLYNFDFAGRMVEAKTGAEARGQTEEDGNNRPYRESFAYNPFDHLTSRASLNWTQN